MSGLLIRNAKVNGESGTSVLCEGGRIARIALDGSISSFEGNAIEANGGTMVPGFIDTHCHPFEFGWLKRSVDLRGTSNITGVRLRLSAGMQRARPGEWVTGMGWDQEAFPGRGMPTREDIDDLSRTNPVALSRVCGHIALLNSVAIQQLALEGKNGPEYERGADGSLTGIVKEEALAEVYSWIPRSVERSAADIQSVEAEAGRLGLTALHCIVSPEGYREELQALASLHAFGALSLRYRVYVPPEAIPYLKEGISDKLNDDLARINGVKIYADGSLGARTAALREPYSDDPTNSGMLRRKDSELEELVEKVDSIGYQALIHAIGDRAVEQAIGALSKVTGSGNPKRHRIEHASLLPKDLRSKMAKCGIRATVQPLFITSDTWAVDRLGEERANDLYPLASMLEDGIVASGSSDSPVESLSPVLGMWAAMTRGGMNPDECLNLNQALSLYTANAASNGFDDLSGTLEVGHPANLTVLDSDVEGMHPALFRKVGVLATVVEGAAVHSYGES